MSYTLHLIAPEQLPDVWPNVSHFITRMCDASHGKFLPQDMVDNFVKGMFQLWVASKDGEVVGCYIGRIVDFPRRRVYEPIAVAGRDMIKSKESWKEMLYAVEHWARNQGCTLIQPLGSPGFEWILRDMGYTKTHVLLEKEL